MATHHKDLVEHCIEVLDSFDPTTKAQEQHVNKYLKYQPELDEDEQAFVVELFSGCVRYDGVLSVVLNGFYNRDGRNVLGSESNLYKVICYLALFRIDELGMVHFRRFVGSQDINKMYKFLNFFIDDKNLRTWIKDQWEKMYERTFVQTELLSPILRWQPELLEFIKQMKDRIANKLKPRKPVVVTTDVKPFNLTMPRPRSIPMPEPIPKLKKTKPAPQTTYVEPHEQTVMEKIRETNRRKAEERLMEASKLQFGCANTEKSQKTKARMYEYIRQQDAQLDFERHTSHPVPHAVLNENIPIKLNTAAILREGKLYQEREAEQLKKLEKLEAGSRDASQFLQWQSQMRQQDLNEQLAEIERRRIAGKLSHEEAILARQNLIQINKQKVAEVKQEAKRLMHEYLEKRLQEEEQMRTMVNDVKDTHENAKDAQKKLQEYKAKIVQEVMAESKDLMRQALEEAEKEMKVKMDLIHKIRAMEAVPVIRFKLLDITATAGHGLLSEMSIAELRERMTLMKTFEEQEEEMKRDEILSSKQVKEQMLMDTLDTISRHRTEQTKAAAVRLEDRKKARNTKPPINDDKLDELQKRLEARRAERLREQEKSKIIPSKKSSQRLKELNAAKRVVEENRWSELEQRRQRTARLTSQGVGTSTAASRIAAQPGVPTMALCS